MRSKADCETCETTTSFEKKSLYGDWECLLCYTSVPVLRNSASSNRESYSNMEHPSLQVGHPDKKITSPSHYKEVCAREGINPNTGEFNTQADQAKSVTKAMLNSKRKIHAPEK